MARDIYEPVTHSFGGSPENYADKLNIQQRQDEKDAEEYAANPSEETYPRHIEPSVNHSGIRRSLERELDEIKDEALIPFKPFLSRRGRQVIALLERPEDLPEDWVDGREPAEVMVARERKRSDRVYQHYTDELHSNAITDAEEEGIVLNLPNKDAPIASDKGWMIPAVRKAIDRHS